MVAVLCRQFGIKHIEIAEDIASDTFLKASENWAINGVPAQPRAWLYAVAKNRTIDYLRRENIFEVPVKKNVAPDALSIDPAFQYTDEIIADSQLAMMFAVCNPMNSAQSQICLALQILCGFSLEEIANAFMLPVETVKKKLQRARSNLRNNAFQIRSLTQVEISERSEAVLRTLYLLFNEGYFSKTDNSVIRAELCSEAMRLALALTENSATNVSQVNALLALMCYQSSRLQARAAGGGSLRFDEQDTNLWDKELINRGNAYLVKACVGNSVSKYHLEAAIAYWHTTKTDSKWTQILKLYDQLLTLEYSPAAVLNRAFVYSKVHGHEAALQQILDPHLSHNSYYHELSGYLYGPINKERAIKHYKAAIGQTRNSAMAKVLHAELRRLTSASGCSEEI